MLDGNLRPGVFSRIVTGLVVVFLITPLAIVVALSFGRSSLIEFPPRAWSLRWYHELVVNPQWPLAALTSVRLGLTVSVAATMLATITALGIARYRGRGRALIQTIILSPLVVPVIVSGVALYYLFSMLGLVGTLTALIIAHILLTFPYGVVVIGSALELFDVRLEHAAMSCGAGPFRTFWRITLPIILPAVLAAALLAFLVSFDEVVMALLLSGPETITLPMQMWNGIRFNLSPVIAAASTVLLVFSAVVVAVGEGLRRRFAASS